MKKETLEQIFKISMAMTLINEHQILSAKNVCVSEKSSIVALIFKRLIPDGQIFNTTNKQYIPTF
ncbi:hypothetical protein OCF84_21090 (plasmid) [Shewanella xiamenensis]|uniref:hypothetical protein n=1 Tax=Shewanella xiamenensis TaxID=332186 RepID=UPI0024ADDACF|nr:hypothetical protein [Shewanella xiamenensis]WHF57754.1 hypothetical protein OCF84_21090 [Shewanella xiamenensis]